MKTRLPILFFLALFTLNFSAVPVQGPSEYVGHWSGWADGQIPFTLDITLGEYDNFGGEKLDYQFYSLTAEYKGFWGQYGMFDDDFDGDYFQIGYDTSVADFDVGLSLLYSDETLAGTSEEALIFSLGKTFDIN